MEFPFDINSVFKTPITKIHNNLLPDGFQGDRRLAGDVAMKVGEVITALGEASANAQGLSQPITTGHKVRNQDHNVYVLTDPNGRGGRGTVTGILKTGKKNLYVFDDKGEHKQVNPTCVLDFYVHESQQRAGKGKQLFEHMLKEERIQHPAQLAIDRPSSKLLNFLGKHYGLTNSLPQSNNFVVYDEFFKDPKTASRQTSRHNSAQLSRANGLQDPRNTNQPTYQGRYGAPRPPCSMGQIIHNMPANNGVLTQEPTGYRM